MRRSTTRWSGPVVAVLILVTATACQAPLQQRQAGVFTAGVITPQGMDRYELSASGGRMVIRTASGNTGGNLRTVFVHDDAPVVVDQQACVTWTGKETKNLIQPGIALRVRSTTKRTQAVTITNNILWGQRGAFNVHIADSDARTADADRRMRLVGQVPAPWAQQALPWRICARAQGTTLQIKTWSLATNPSEPTWSDPVHAHVVRLPPEAVYSGRPGFYIAHLRPGEQTGFENLTFAATPATRNRGAA